MTTFLSKYSSKYTLLKTQLVMELSKHENYAVLDAMLAITKITWLEFAYVCKTNLTTWWSPVFDQMAQAREAPRPFNVFDSKLTKF